MKFTTMEIQHVFT